MKRSYGEVVRAAHHLKSLRAMLESIELVLQAEDPPGSDAQQALMMEAYSLAQCVSRLDAYRRAEADLVIARGPSFPAKLGRTS